MKDEIKVNVITVNDLQRLCNDLIENGKGDYRFVVNHDWKYSLIEAIRFKDDSKSVIVR